eukprot:scaffold42733_cov66-Cyclotella_meneghiniana.AAC.3
MASEFLFIYHLSSVFHSALHTCSTEKIDVWGYFEVTDRPDRPQSLCAPIKPHEDRPHAQFWTPLDVPDKSDMSHVT